jgi:hypothetical protein
MKDVNHIIEGILEQAVRQAICPWCDEPILPDDPKVPILGVEVRPRSLEITPIHSFMHMNCSLRQVYGSIGHQLKKCGCYGGSEWDPQDMTKRQAADAAVAHWRNHNAN